MSSCCSCQAPVDEAVSKRSTGWMRVAFAGLIAAQSMIFSLAVNISPPDGRTRVVLHTALAVSAVVVFLLVGIPLLRTALGALRRGRIVFEQLFLIGICAAFAASLQSTLTGTGHVYYEIVAILLAIYTFGRIIGDRRRAAALDAAKSLGQEFDLCDRIAPTGEVLRVPVREIKAGDIVLVSGSGSIPIDGQVIQGRALVNESALTGEPFPVAKEIGDDVRAGSYCLDAPLRIRTSVAGTERELDGILSRVAAAQSQPSHLERESDRIVTWFLPSVLGVAIVTFLVWTALASWTIGLFNALSVILVACPCSMGLATPIGIWSALADLAKRGLIPHTSDLIERLAKVDAVAFDKTGTLSEDELELIDLVTPDGIDAQRLHEEIATLETSSTHPIARALRGQPSSRQVIDVRVLPGVGIAGLVDGVELRIGNALLLDGKTIESTHPASHQIHILREGVLAGTAFLKERLREPARETLSDLQAAGISYTILTGDRPEGASVHQLDHVQAGLSPQEKADQLHKLSSRALFVGDGINDTPAMTAAYASLCLASGCGTAREVAMGELRDLRAIPYAIARSRAAVRTIRQNLFFAATYNFIGIAFAASGVLHPVAAALLMLLSSFTVSWRALRQPRIELPRANTPAVPPASCCSSRSGIPQPV